MINVSLDEIDTGIVHRNAHTAMVTKVLLCCVELADVTKII